MSEEREENKVDVPDFEGHRVGDVSEVEEPEKADITKAETGDDDFEAHQLGTVRPEKVHDL